MTKDSISITLVREALQAVPALAAEKALEQAGIVSSALTASDGRVSASTYAALWRAVATGMNDEFFNMARRPLPEGSLAFIWRSARGQGTVGAGVSLALEGLRLMLGSCSASLERQRSLAIIDLDTGPEPARAFTCFTFWIIVHGLTCWLAARRVPVLVVELQGPAPGDCDDYRRFFGENLRFEQPRSRLVFAADCLDLPVRRTEADLERSCGELPANLLVKYRNPAGFAKRVRDTLRAQPPTAWPEAPALAAAYGMSEATLRRKLALEGQSLQQVKASLRKARAIAWLGEEGASIAQIAERLGFADERSFHRAFRQWFGCNPGHYRSLIAKTGENAHPE